MKGIVFDIEQMTVSDGPGVRTTVFLKGCPLHCSWCHNPEGMRREPELMVSSRSCRHCGRCSARCKSPEHCTACGACIRVCPEHLRKICGVEWEAEALAGFLKKDQALLTALGGGITFSGGEPAAQAPFVLQTVQAMPGMHCAMETSAYCEPELFRALIQAMDYIIMDIKHTDEAAHLRYTGVSNRVILENLEQLKHAGKPFRIRVPLIPGVNDSKENLEQTAALLEGVQTLTGVELLPYHKTAGAKYEMVGRSFRPDFDTEQLPNADLSAFLQRGIPCRVL